MELQGLPTGEYKTGHIDRPPIAQATCLAASPEAVLREALGMRQSTPSRPASGSVLRSRRLLSPRKVSGDRAGRGGEKLGASVNRLDERILGKAIEWVEGAGVRGLPGRHDCAVHTFDGRLNDERRDRQNWKSNRAAPTTSSRQAQASARASGDLISAERLAPTCETRGGGANGILSPGPRRADHADRWLPQCVRDRCRQRSILGGVARHQSLALSYLR